MKSLIIYFNVEKTSFQVIKPSDKFDGNYGELARAISGGRHHSWAIA